MSRNRKSAKTAGTRFERTTADYMRDVTGQPIDRLVKTGAKDRGDVGPLRNAQGDLVAVECKDTSRLELSQWIGEAHIEAINYDAVAGIIVHKRKGFTAPGKQWVTMTLDDLLTIMRVRND
ncbi:hypothetical protein QPX10_10530 [Corynebacterium pseudodiphtheriticum]|uniref:putative PDDEXK endonuclease n=1 Tax=Corynebacterium TaxID=1716 RepID=UPI002541E867|nr:MULTISPECIES: hypothetical protein [Corynebacterium]MDK4244101.1 hypothetical protein [Corynebacterium pseudodiphtheriticum]MDK4258477.1 hypothetical protein [Corynebacterium propinquum]